MKKFVLTDNMRHWFREWCLNEEREQRGAASNNHAFALGSTGQSAIQLESYAKENRAYAQILREIAKELDTNGTVELTISVNGNSTRSANAHSANDAEHNWQEF